MRWTTGIAEIEKLVAEGRLQAVRGAQADGLPWLAKARRTANSAAELASSDSDSAYVLAYDAVRQACTALLVQQGLRPTTAGGHYVVEQAVRAQFGDRFKGFGSLRRRRNEIEYPAFPGEWLDEVEALQAVAQAQEIVGMAEQLVAHLGLFGTVA